jgi:hypothetical protein
LFARPSSDEIRNLQKEFVSTRPAKVPRISRPKGASVRNKVTMGMVKKIYELRYNLHYSFDRISRAVNCAPTTAHAALRRFESRNGDFHDQRLYNGRNNKRLKIVPNVSKHLLDPKIL